MKITILLNGDLEQDLKIGKFDSLICADGGAEHARALGIIPDYIIGDFDSISANTLEYFGKQGVEIREAPDQDHTDFQKALELAVELGATEISVYGAIGAELDHSLGNLLCLSEVARDIEIVLKSKEYEIYRVCDKLSLDLKPQTIVSVIALTKVRGLSYEGLKWKVKDRELRQNWLGLRNKSTGAITISLDAGQVLVIIAKNK